MSTPPTRPLYLGTGPSPAFCLFHPVEPGGAPGTAVLLVPPWGWEEVASYRGCREWAERLAAAGHPTLRLALPATGNSAGAPGDPGLVDAWVAVVAAAAAWLRGESGAPRVAALGLGLGGLLARAALARGAAIDELVLWGAPASGRAFVRQAGAFSRMQPWHAEEELSAGLPEGWVEAGGFVLSAETLAALGELAPAQDDSAAPARRTLTLERDAGWAELTSDLERSRLPLKTADRVAAWLDEGAREGVSAAAGGDAPPAADELELEVEWRAIRERPLDLGAGAGEAFALLCEPAADPLPGLCAVFLNAGAVRNVGPNRMWVETARRWAAAGARSVRLDLEGIGEAGGAAPASVPEFYEERFERQLGRVLDRLAALDLGERFLLVGLCGGGFWAFRTALEDGRVRLAVLVNAGALAWAPGILAQREARRLGRLAEGRWWGRLLRGEIGRERLWAWAKALLRALPRMASRPFRGRNLSLRAEIEAGLNRLAERGTALSLAFAADDPLAEELAAYGILDRLDRWPNVTLSRLPGCDHTLRPTATQLALRELLDGELRKEAAREVKAR